MFRNSQMSLERNIHRSFLSGQVYLRLTRFFRLSPVESSNSEYSEALAATTLMFMWRRVFTQQPPYMRDLGHSFLFKSKSIQILLYLYSNYTD